jgi:acyl-CoA thioesterase I
VPPAAGQLVVVKAGVGGDCTRDGLKRIDTDVLAHHPDLVVIMFGANDENRAETGNNVPVAEYRQNLATMVASIRQAGGEPVLMTTSMKNLRWIGTVGNLNEYAAAVRSLAAEQKVCLVDNFRAWELLPTRGYNYMILLDSCINHPNDLGHEVFFAGLRAAFEAGAAR